MAIIPGFYSGGSSSIPEIVFIILKIIKYKRYEFVNNI